MITKLKSISIKEIDAHGNEYQDRQGNPQARVAIQIENPAYEGKWLATFTEPTSHITKWQRGEEIDIQITEKNGFINFKPTKPASKAMADSFRAKVARDDEFFAGAEKAGEILARKDLPANEAEVMKILQAMKEQLGWLEDIAKESRRFQEECKTVLERIEFNQTGIDNRNPFV